MINGPRGPHGIQQRITEIESRLNEKLGRPEQPMQEFEQSFQGNLSARPGGLSGELGGFRPFDPFGGSASVDQANIRAMVQGAAARNGLDPKLFEALVGAESGFNPGAVSSAGAQGLAQLMPGTARALGVTNPFDPQQNLEGGARYLKQMLDKYGGDTRLALAAYNAGPGAVDRFGGVPPFEETRNYVDKILKAYGAQQ